jgi:hypothetical protein
MAVPTDGFVWNPKGWDGLGCIFFRWGGGLCGRTVPALTGSALLARR